MGKTERAKIDSYILAEFRDSAKTNGYPETLSEAMVTLGPAIYRLKRESEKRFVREPDLTQYGLNPDGSRREGESAETGWQMDRKVLDTDRLLTMIADEAIDLGFAKTKIANETELVRYALGETATTASIRRFEPTWSEDLVGWLTSPAVRGVLMLLLMLGAYMELQSPGVGLPGAVALIALILVLGAPYLAGLADMMEVFLIVIGIGLLAVEMFVLPGFGIAGFCGLLLMGIGFILTFAENEPGPNVLPLLLGTWRMLATGLITTVVALAFSIVGFVFLTRYFGSIPLLNRMILAEPVSSVISPVGAVDSRVGSTGRVISDLRPSGRMVLEGEHVDVVSRGAVIETGSLVRVVEVAGNRIVVEEVAS